MVKKRTLLLSILLFLIIGIFLGFFLNQNFFSQNLSITRPTNPTFKNCPYRYINQLRCEPDLAPKKKEYTALRNDLLEYIKQQQQIGSVTTASVYFRDLENGPVLSINGEADYAPASLLKLPLMIAFYQKAEYNPSLLQKTIKIPQEATLQQNIAPEVTPIQGNAYTIDELITILITQSDNLSGQLLLTYLDKTYPKEDFIFILGDLGIIDPRKSVNEQYVNAETYASIFRLLYNSSYLNAEMSNKALQLLTQSDFKQGILAGVPSGVQIAHKFGERKDGDTQQLHDCGIVYYPPNPYILCVMTKGHDISTLEPVIQQVSRDVYEAVKSQS